MAGNKITIIDLNGTVRTYTSTGAVSVSADGKTKTFNGRRTGTNPAETTDKAMTIFEDKVIDQSVEAQ